jgi:hypothetical protein
MDVKTSQIPVAETARPQVTAALASQFGPKQARPAPGWIKHDQTLGVQMDLSIDPPFVSICFIN